VSELAPARIRTSVGDVSAIFALDGWLLLDAAGRSTQLQCLRPRQPAVGLVAAGLPEDEADRVAHELWRQRPSDASMPTNSQSVVRSIGNQWAVAVILLVVLALFVLAFALRRMMTGR
jgi:hypothetical protein